MKLPGAIRRHPAVVGLLALIAVSIVWFCADHDARGAGHAAATKALVYLATCVAAAFAADWIAARTVHDDEPIEVRRPGHELTMLGLMLFGGFLFLAARAFTDWERVRGLGRLALLVLALLFLFQIGQAIWLLASGYRPRHLGLRVQGLYAGAATLVMTAAAALAVDPDGVTLGRAVEGYGGLHNVVLFGLFGEPLSEEFMRFTLQTRIGAVTRNAAASWLAASVPWALLHVPMWLSRGDGGVLGGCMGALCILPIGLLWGFLQWRTRSLLPALLAHGFNLWGLQNL